MRLILVDYEDAGLKEITREITSSSAHVVAIRADLREADQRKRVVREAGNVDVLINNAGIEFTRYFHTLEADIIHDTIAVNLEAPLHLTNLLLPGMLRERRGHIVSISSLAFVGTACQEVYSATKAGLHAFTYALRATYKGMGVSASTVLPGFIETGIYSKLMAASGLRAPRQMGTSTPATVVRSVLRVIERDQPEEIVNSLPMRPLLATRASFPRLGEAWISLTGAGAFFKKVAAKHL